MNSFLRLTATLAVVAAIAASALAFTFAQTKDSIAAQEAAAKEKALEDVFFQGFARTEGIGDGVTAVYLESDTDTPSYYAVEGAAIGYNASVPIQLLVGLTHPDRPAAPLLEGYAPEDRMPPEDAKGLYVAGWKVVKSEETPGLGEKAKEQRAPYTLAEKLTGTATDSGPDSRTAFQKQFAGLKAGEVKLKKSGGTIDVITAATYSTQGIVGAIHDAADRLRETLKNPPEKADK